MKLRLSEDLALPVDAGMQEGHREPQAAFGVISYQFESGNVCVRGVDFADAKIDAGGNVRLPATFGWADRNVGGSLSLSREAVQAIVAQHVAYCVFGCAACQHPPFRLTQESR